jgi:hypothetical protein
VIGSRDPSAFRTAVEQRLLNAATEGGRPVARARKLLAFDRLLPRLQHAAAGRWVLELVIMHAMLLRASLDPDGG